MTVVGRPAWRCGWANSSKFIEESTKAPRIQELVGVLTAREESEDPRPSRRDKRLGLTSGQAPFHDGAGGQVNDEAHVADSALFLSEFLNSSQSLLL